MNYYGNDPSGAIAMYIAAALQHPNPPCNGAPRRVSTIVVYQHKNKFNYVVVYCRLADPTEITAAWLEQGNTGEPTSEFVRNCLIRDAAHYRKCYCAMQQLMPDQTAVIFYRADYPELLQINEEDLRAYLEFSNEFTKNRRGECSYMLERWGTSNIEELYSLLCQICGFK